MAEAGTGTDRERSESLKDHGGLSGHCWHSSRVRIESVAMAADTRFVEELACCYCGEKIERKHGEHYQRY